MSYRGPNTRRLAAQQREVAGYAGETGVWRQYVSAASGLSGLWAGAGITRYYQERAITGLWAAPQIGESRFRETQLPGGQVMAGDVVLSTPDELGPQDEVVWRGVTYRVEGDATPIHMGGRVWYRTVLRRGDATG